MARAAEGALEDRAAAPVGAMRASEDYPAVASWEKAGLREVGGTRGAAAVSEDRIEAQQVERTAVVRKEMAGERWAAQGEAEETMAATAGWEAVGEKMGGMVSREAVEARVAA